MHPERRRIKSFTVKARPKTTPTRPARKRRSPIEDGVAAAQRVFAKVLEKADPKAKVAKNGR